MGANEEFLKLFLRHQGGVKAFLGSVVWDPAAAEDLFQETSLALWESFAQYDPARSFGAWARGIAFKKVLRRREKSRRLPLAFSPQAIQAVLEAYERTEASSPDLDGLRDCVAKLTDRARSLLALRYERALTLGGIAKETGSTLDAVHKMLSRIREMLLECVQRRLQSESR
jgi:RNA polymerase sigma-70 factor (ECF subfamily)